MTQLLLPNFQALSEFWGFHDTCGPDALLMTLHALFNNGLSGPEVDALRADMLGDGWFAPGGCTMNEIQLEAAEDGYQTIYPATWHWADPTPSHMDAIHQGLVQYAGQQGLILQVNAAHNLTGNEGGVGSHFVAVGGIDSTLGYLIGNGDDVNALASHNGHGKIIPTRWMSWGVLQSAQPTALLGIVRPATMVVPAGWTDDGTTLTAPNHIPVVKGFRNAILSEEFGPWNKDNWPLIPEFTTDSVEPGNPAIGPGARQDFRLVSLGYTASRNVYVIYVGQDILAYRMQVAHQQSAIDAAKKDLGA